MYNPALSFSVDGVLIVIIFFLLYLLSMIWPPDSPWAPWWQMPQEVIDAMYKKLNLKKSDVVYDLGCGTGKAIIAAANGYGATSVGIEIDPLRFFLAKINVLKSRSRAKVIKRNFFKIDLSGASVIIMYLIPNALKRLAPKLSKELQKGTKIVSFVYPLPEKEYKKFVELVSYEKQYRLYVYKVI
ncbi:MAG TPA: class I SAM-dependent methyltransferase [Patescibacteria group bacterium]|nr:class I SAM-dependent methyltransferase [Patescibacteria group bacterium]